MISSSSNTSGGNSTVSSRRLQMARLTSSPPLVLHQGTSSLLRIWHCYPLSEGEFRGAIEDTYLSASKFNFGLSYDQVSSKKGVMEMGRGNGQKSKMAHERNLEKQKGARTK
ncbi:hypothetical protein NL676_008605 [Syzygium grande]|nr:hypothetical protein NL676_008605 [Syzygium grande]